MGEGSRAALEGAAGPGRRLRELAAAVAEARRRLASTGGPGGLPDQLGQLQVLLRQLPEAAADARHEPGTLLSLLDEVAGLVGQLEFAREAVRARVVAIDRHRRAGRSYAGGRRRP